MRDCSESGELDHLSESASIFLNALVKLECIIKWRLGWISVLRYVKVSLIGILKEDKRFTLTVFSDIKADLDQLILYLEKLPNVLKSIQIYGNK